LGEGEEPSGHDPCAQAAELMLIGCVSEPWPSCALNSKVKSDKSPATVTGNTSQAPLAKLLQLPDH
jgi:hypothetical protein